MSWEAKARFLGLSWEMVSRTSSGKLLRPESWYPESLGFLRLWLFWLSTLGVHFTMNFRFSEADASSVIGGQVFRHVTPHSFTITECFPYGNVSHQTSIFTHETKMLISTCWKCFFSFQCTKYGKNRWLHSNFSLLHCFRWFELIWSHNKFVLLHYPCWYILIPDSIKIKWLTKLRC